MSKKVPPYSRRKLRGLFRSYVRANLLGLTAIALGACGASALMSWLILASSDAASRLYILGVLHAISLALVWQFAYLSFLAHEAEAIWQLRGSWGEENTRELLRTAKRRRIIWGWVDSIDTQHGDIDHLVLTRRGGVVALDSKWRSEADTVDPKGLVPAARKTKIRSDAILRTVLRSERGSHRARADAVTTRSVVVIWGRAQIKVPEDYELDGVAFVPGFRLIKWLRTLDGERVDRRAATEILHGLQTFRASSQRSINS